MGILFEVTESSFYGMDLLSFVGIIIVFLSVLKTINYKIAFTNSRIEGTNLGLLGELKYSRIDKIEVYDEMFKVFYNSEIEKSVFTNHVERDNLIKFIETKVGEKLVMKYSA